ncbi:MAG: sensor protein [Frankiales bacterium]|nr:sensor protein [Frankiales bacterium]
MTSTHGDATPPVPVELPQDRTAASVARARTRTVLGNWRMPGLLDPLLLVVSELVGNAVRHGRPPVAMLLRRTARGVRVEVHDEATTAPRRAAGLPADSAESGRGSFLVDAVSDETGVEQIPGDGKVVWATVTDDTEQPA